MSVDEKFMRMALSLAKKGESLGEVPVGAVLVHESKVIAQAYNQVELLQDATAHAEMLALTAGAGYFHNFRLTGTTLYTTLEPCLMCAGAILLSRVSRVVWGAKDLRHGGAGSVVDLFSLGDKIHKLEITTGVLAEECSALLSHFFEKLREQT